MIPLYENSKGVRLAAITIIVISIFFNIYFQGLSEQSGRDVNLNSLPYKFGEWEGIDTDGLDSKSRDILQLDRFIKRAYKNSQGRVVFLYIGYWKKQSGEQQAAKHSPALCLPSNGWLLSTRSTSSFTSENLTIPVKKIIAEYKSRPHYFHYYFFTGTTYYAQEWRALLNISTQTFLSGRSDGGIVEASADIIRETDKQSAEEGSDALITKFLQDLNPELRKIIDNPIKD